MNLEWKYINLDWEKKKVLSEFKMNKSFVSLKYQWCLSVFGIEERLDKIGTNLSSFGIGAWFKAYYLFAYSLKTSKS
jgi:hypothetical protein